MFWVISTAFVLHGVTMVARGPIKKSVKTDSSILGWLPNNHFSFFIFLVEIAADVWTVKTVFFTSPKK